MKTLIALLLLMSLAGSAFAVCNRFGESVVCTGGEEAAVSIQ